MNRAVRSTQDVLRTVGGRLRISDPSHREIRAVTTDSRAVEPGDVFFAISGGRHEGSRFVQDAVTRGAAMVVVPAGARLDLASSATVVADVPDTRLALGRIAAAWRRGLSALRVIAITGSAGKTTTKRLVHAALATRLTGRAAPASFNNDLGVPVTLLSARPGDRYLVVEVGTNAPGEISALSRLADPDLAVITSIGRAHLGGFGSCEAILREKASILQALGEGRAAVVRDLDQGLAPFLRGIAHVIRFGETEEADIRMTAHDPHTGAIEVNGRSRFRLALHGRHNAVNALAAIAVARRMGIDDDSIAAGLLSVEPEAMRLCREVIGGLEIWNDAYNANPESMRAAMETVTECSDPAQKRWGVFGAMNELGEAAGELHEALAADVAARIEAGTWSGAIFVGPYAVRQAALVGAAAGADVAKSCSEFDPITLAALVRQVCGASATVLIKGSRAARLESVVDALRQDADAEVNAHA